MVLRVVICAVGALRKRLTGLFPGSSHNRATERQAKALQAVLADDASRDFAVQSCFASTPPYIDDALGRASDREIVVSMIPTDSRLSCGLVCRTLASTAIGDPAPPACATVLARMWDDPAFIDVQCAHIAALMASHGEPVPSSLVLLLHGTLVRDKQGRRPDFHTGCREKKAYGNALLDALRTMHERPWVRVEIAYLNHGVGGEWSAPSAAELLRSLAAEGVRGVAVYPCEHLVDGIETQHLSRVLRDAGLPEGRVLAPLNDSPEFIAYLAARVREALGADSEANLCDPCPRRASRSN